MDDVELRLDLVAAHVVHGGDVLVEDQVFGGGWKPEKKQLCPDWSLNVNEIKKKPVWSFRTSPSSCGTDPC